MPPEALNGEYAELDDPGFRGRMHRGFLAAVLFPDWIVTTKPAADSMIKDSPETTVYRLTPPRWGGDVIVKRYNRPGPWAAWKDLLRTPRALGSFRRGTEFLREGIPTPAPLAALVPRRGDPRSWLVTRVAPGFRSLSKILEETPPGHADRRNLLEDLCNLIREMHRRHVYHGDLKPVNILVRADIDCLRLSLIDLDAARIRRRFSWSLAVRDLGQLDSYIRPEAPGYERRRFFALYTAGWSRADRRRFLAGVIRESDRKGARRCAG
ncbi:MAG: hypothetical protein O7H41_21935 [Planctomycetota bacterium]|nr:hypothetical protein [Planctomycetota bacterium]